MIISRLYELAVRQHLLSDPAFKDELVKYVIRIGSSGEYLGLMELVGNQAKAEASEKSIPNRGKELAVPVPHGSPNAPGFARFFADTLARVLPLVFDLVKLDETKATQEKQKRDRSRATFWSQIGEAALATQDPALNALVQFGRLLVEDQSLVERINKNAEALGATGADRCTLAWDDDQGTTILDRESVQQFYRGFYKNVAGLKMEAGPTGVCQITGEVGPIPTTHPMKIQGVPGGLSTGVSLVSYDKDAFQSYGLDGTANAGIGYEAVEGYTRALTALIQERLPDYPRTCLRAGKVLFLIWSREPDAVVSEIVEGISEPTTETVQTLRLKQRQARETRAGVAHATTLLESPHTGKTTTGPRSPNRLYCLSLSANAARAIVRDYLEVPLADATNNLAQWFEDLQIVQRERNGAISSAGHFPLAILAAATAAETDKIGPEVYPNLFAAALQGPRNALPDSILLGCLRRNRAESNKIRFQAPRMALIKLFLLRRDLNVSESLDETNRNPAYVCGRLMALLEEIQFAALGKNVNANVGDKFYSAFSTTPSMVFARLVDNARKHLRKIRNDNAGTAVNLTRRLADLLALMQTPPPGVLSPIQQGAFALGYYHQIHHKFEAIAARKAEALELATPEEVLNL